MQQARQRLHLRFPHQERPILLLEIEKSKGLDRGVWDSMNIIDVKTLEQNKKYEYKITSSLILDLKISN